MLKRSFAIILTLSCCGVLAYGQDAGKAKEKIAKDKVERTFAFSFGDDGGYLGIQTVDVSKDNLGKYNLSSVRGVAIEKVMDNSPAAAAGLQSGDVILRFENEEITSVRKLTRLIGEVAPDHTVHMTISRNGGEQEITATLGKREGPKFENGNFTFAAPLAMEKLGDLKALKELPGMGKMAPMPAMPNGVTPHVFGAPGEMGKAFAWTFGGGRSVGVGVMPLTKQLASHYNVDGGVLVTNVREDSPAARAGIVAGDIIIQADSKDVKSDLDLVRTINEKKDGYIQITVQRDGKRMSFSVTPEASKDSGFVFGNDGENGTTIAPSTWKMAVPAMPASPGLAPLPTMTVRPARVL